MNVRHVLNEGADDGLAVHLIPCLFALATRIDVGDCFGVCYVAVIIIIILVVRAAFLHMQRRYTKIASDKQTHPSWIAMVRVVGAHSMDRNWLFSLVWSPSLYIL